MRIFLYILILSLLTLPIASVDHHHMTNTLHSKEEYSIHPQISSISWSSWNAKRSISSHHFRPLISIRGSALHARNLSDMIFHYYYKMENPWPYTPNMTVEWAFDFADAEYKSFLQLKSSNYGLSFVTISYLAYTFRNETYISDAEEYWEWLYEKHVNKTTLVMNKASASGFTADLGFQ